MKRSGIIIILFFSLTSIFSFLVFAAEIGRDLGKGVIIPTLEECAASNYVYGFDSAGRLMCRADVAGGVDIDTSAYVNCSGAEIFYGNGSCGGVADFFDDTTVTDTSAYVNCSTDEVFLGNGSCWGVSTFPAGSESDPIWESNWSLGYYINHTKTVFSLWNSTWDDRLNYTKEVFDTYNSTWDNDIINFTSTVFDLWNSTWDSSGEGYITPTNIAWTNETNVFAENQNFSKNITVGLVNIWYNGSGLCIGAC